MMTDSNETIKQEYETLEVEVIRFKAEDIITQSITTPNVPMNGSSFNIF